METGVKVIKFLMKCTVGNGVLRLWKVKPLVTSRGSHSGEQGLGGGADDDLGRGAEDDPGRGAEGQAGQMAREEAATAGDKQRTAQTHSRAAPTKGRADPRTTPQECAPPDLGPSSAWSMQSPCWICLIGYCSLFLSHGEGRATRQKRIIYELSQGPSRTITGDAMFEDSINTVAEQFT
ncbi:hypothetical protein E1301_Tti009513 [Triplophysa tibetana]|uniref:Uncharacterized protein n=1 Tax=Triplophysa tibetana TaxID=1572043 RepID=A0A5A9P710_9TELE|nr:hypothetical protein E1301_Tti009513 [Triplophysa tibetana]